jgi:uncharacterized RDD family membrane protein YckC
MQQKPTVGIRLVSMLVDHFAMTFLMVISMLILSLPLLLSGNSSSIPIGFKVFGGGMLAFLMAVVFSFYLNKDAFNGQSIAKRILKLQVRDYKTGEIATPIKCLIRNITMPVWPIEVLATFFNPGRKLGDRLAGTMVVMNEENLKGPTNWKQILIVAIVGPAILFLIFFLLFFLQVLPELNS